MSDQDRQESVEEQGDGANSGGPTGDEQVVEQDEGEQVVDEQDKQS